MHQDRAHLVMGAWSDWIGGCRCSSFGYGQSVGAGFLWV